MSDVQTPLARFANAVAGTGSGLAAVLGALLVSGWFITGLLTGFPHNWHVLVHSVSAAVALVMVFVIQYASHRQSRAILLKLDELIRADEEARNAMIRVEHAPVGEQERLEQQMHAER
jgi:low affinity Fe/Cu permease